MTTRHLPTIKSMATIAARGDGVGGVARSAAQSELTALGIDDVVEMPVTAPQSTVTPEAIRVGALVDIWRRDGAGAGGGRRRGFASSQVDPILDELIAALADLN